MSVVLRPMTQTEFEAWLPGQIVAYAASKVAAGNWSQEQSLDESRKQFASLVPQGVATVGHAIYVVQAEAGDVGHLWVHVKGSSAFIYEFEIEATKRGLGLGSAALSALEADLRSRGVTRLGLHVFGYNTGARRLYERHGFEVTNINMAKTL